MELKHMEMHNKPKQVAAHKPAQSRSKRFLHKVFVEPVRKASVYIAAGALAFTLTFSCAGKPVQVASLGEYFPKAAEAKSTGKPSPKAKDQKIAPEKKEGEKKKKTIEYIEVSKLEEYRAAFVEKQKKTYSKLKMGDVGYEELTSNEVGFVVEATTNKHPLIINDGKEALVIFAYISKKKEVLEKGGVDAGGISVGIYDTTTGLQTDGIARNLDDVIADYRVKHNGEYPPAIHLTVEMGTDKNVGEYYQPRVTAASSEEKVKNGKIEEGMPVVWVSHVAATGDGYTNDSLMAYTTAPKKSSKGVIAKNK